MAVVPPVPDAERRTSYTLVAETGPKNVGFDIYGNGSDYADWIEVWLDGVKLTPTTQWTLDSPSGALASLERPITDARVTLVTASTGDLEIVGADKPQRTTQQTEGTGETARSRNQTYSHLVIRLRELFDKFSRTILAPPGETIAVLVPAAERASSNAAWDAEGNLIASSGNTDPNVIVSTFMETVLDDTTAAAARTTLGAQETLAWGNWKVVYTDGSGDIVPLALGADATILAGNGVSAAPTFRTLDNLGGVLKAGGQNLTGGFTTTSYDAGTKSSGTFTPDPLNGHIQHATNNGAHTLAPPANPCTIVLEYTNGASAGSVTTSGFTEVSGESLTTTNGHKFILFITKTNSWSSLHIRALQ